MSSSYIYILFLFSSLYPTLISLATFPAVHCHVSSSSRHAPNLSSLYPSIPSHIKPINYNGYIRLTHQNNNDFQHTRIARLYDLMSNSTNTTNTNITNSTDPMYAQFLLFIQTYNKTYSSTDDELYHYHIFQYNLQRIATMNAQHANDKIISIHNISISTNNTNNNNNTTANSTIINQYINSTTVYGINEFTDILPSEFDYVYRTYYSTPNTGLRRGLQVCNVFACLFSRLDFN